MPGSSRAGMRTGPSRAASGTTFPRKPRKPSPKRSSTSTSTERSPHVSDSLQECPSHRRSRPRPSHPHWTSPPPPPPAFAPEEGERLGDVEGGSRDSVLNAALVPLHYPGDGGEAGVEFAIDPDKFRDAFAADLPPERAAVMAATQRPVADSAFSEPSGPPAWKSAPSWAVVGTGDRAAGADVTRSMAERAGATIIEAEGSHVIMVSQPEIVANVIMTAAAAVGGTAAAAPR